MRGSDKAPHTYPHTEGRVIVPIANVIQRGTAIYVYNEKGQQIFVKTTGSGPNDGLKGYTTHSVNIQRGHVIYTYNEKGMQTGAKHA